MRSEITSTLTLATHGHHPSFARSPPIINVVGADVTAGDRRPHSVDKG